MLADMSRVKYEKSKPASNTAKPKNWKEERMAQLAAKATWNEPNGAKGYRELKPTAAFDPQEMIRRIKTK
jgi:hypothetical protein